MPHSSNPKLTPRLKEVVRLYEARWPVEAIAEKLGLSISSVRTYAWLARRNGTPIQRNHSCGNTRKIDYHEMCRLACEGWKAADLAARYGVGKTAISNAMKLMRESGAILPPGGRWPKKPSSTYGDENSNGL